MANFLNSLSFHGHGIYVWPAYGLVVGLLGWQLLLPWLRLRKLDQKQKGEHAQTE